MKKLLITIALLFSITLTSANAAQVTMEEKITGLYVAFFDRAADQTGLEYWTNKADEVAKQGGDVSAVFKTLSAGFATHPTFKSTYDHLNNEEFVALIYRNALGRDGDAEGIAYWTDLIDRSMSRSDMVATFVELSLVTYLTKENYPSLSDAELAAAQLRQDLITNKVTVALTFTNQLGVLSNVVNASDPESDPAYLASIGIISEVTEKETTVSNVLDFLVSIINSNDQVGDILRAGHLIGPSLLKKTGQTKSYDEEGNEVTDGSIKDDGYYQTGITSYTRDDSKEIVIDHVTGLMWQDDTAAVKKSWIESYSSEKDDTSGDTATTYCADLSLGGYADWRLPTISELQGIVDHVRINPRAKIEFLNVEHDYYWSSTSFRTGSSGWAWIVSFYNPGFHDALKSYDYNVRCVRQSNSWSL